MIKSFIVNLSIILGVLGVGFLYFLVVIINIFIGIKLDKKKKEEDFN